jgi:hypothetical protein
MKPSLFIGSSVEGLPIANAIQQNLEHDCNPNIWSQGIFQLSSTVLDDLLAAIKTYHFAIFVFTPDDLIKIRDNTIATVRDNIVFELGLFFGGLGKERVFYVKPRGGELQIPSDLLGITPGTYDEQRDDQNLMAALGPFCNQVREKFKVFVYESLNDLQNETKEVKRIAAEKPKCWEYLLLAELLESRLSPLNHDYADLENGSVFQQTVVLDSQGSLDFLRASLNDMMKLIVFFSNLILKEIEAALGPAGTPARIIDLKNVADKFLVVAKELIAWEYRLQGAETTDEFREIIEIMKGWTKIYFRQLDSLSGQYKRTVTLYIEGKNKGEYGMHFEFLPPPGLERVNEILRSFNL